MVSGENKAPLFIATWLIRKRVYAINLDFWAMPPINYHS